MTDEETAFFARTPAMLDAYEALREKLLDAYPDMGIKVSRTQVSFRNRHIFAMVSLPERKIKGNPERYMIVSFGLGYKNNSPRVWRCSEPYPNRWTHHTVVESARCIDAELMGLIDEAYWFSMSK